MESNTNVMFDGYLRKQEVLEKLRRMVNTFPHGSLERDIWNDACHFIEDIHPTWAHWISYGRFSSGDSLWEKSYKCSECGEDPSISELDSYCSCCGKPMNGIITNEPCQYFNRKLGSQTCKRSEEECSCEGDVDRCDIGRGWRASYRR